MIIEPSEIVSLRQRLTDVDQSEEERFLDVIYLLFILYLIVDNAS